MKTTSGVRLAFFAYLFREGPTPPDTPPLAWAFDNPWTGYPCSASLGLEHMAMTYHDLITIEPAKRAGKPCIRGLRITVYDMFEYLASGMSEEVCRSA